MVEAVRGEGRTGRVGLVSILKERNSDTESGIEPPFPRIGELAAPLLPRRIVGVCVCMDGSFEGAVPRMFVHICMYISRPVGRRAGGPARG